MLSLFKWIAAPALAFGLMFAGDSSTAQAQYPCYSGYGGGYAARGVGISVGFGHYPSRAAYYPSARYGAYYGAHRRGFYHDTTHYDYHPRTVVRHGHHYHVIPGHYDLHRTGHWHR